MPRLKPLALADIPAELRPVFDGAESYMGFVANDALTMALLPDVLRTALPFMRAIYSDGRVSFDLKRLVGMMSSWAGGCQYCVAHTAHGAARLGVAEEKIAALPNFATSPLYSDAERAALRLAAAAGQVPNATTDADFAVLRLYFDDVQIAEIVATIALFGFLNRWNATLATELESSPLRFAQRALTASGWSAGDHAATTSRPK